MGQVGYMSARAIHAVRAPIRQLQAVRAMPGLSRANGNDATNRWRGRLAAGMLPTPSPGGPWWVFGRLTGMLGAAVLFGFTPVAAASEREVP